jgi:DNA polymerase-3 subunit alpha
VAIRPEWLQQASAGLIVLAGRDSDVGQISLEGKLDRAAARLERWQRHFGDRFYLEVTRTQRGGEDEFFSATLALAAQRDCAVVASNDVRFLEAEDFEAHEARVCISTGRVLTDPRRPRDYSTAQYLKSTEEMARAVRGSSGSAGERGRDRQALQPRTQPWQVLPAGVPGAGRAHHRFVVAQQRPRAWRRVWRSIRSLQATRARATSRASTSSSTSSEDGLPRLLPDRGRLHQLGQEARHPGRPRPRLGCRLAGGLGAGITDLDPMPYDLLFERFLNPERVSMPDFDIDFCMDRATR